MVRPVSAGVCLADDTGVKGGPIMDPDARGEGGSPPGSGDGQTPADPDLSARLRRLDERLTELASDQARADGPRSRLAEDGTAMARGMKLVSEFVGGIVAGGLLGWLVDKLAGTQPFGLLIGLMFGFAAGLRNLYRATQGTSGQSR
jgi:ATP synthase protein I